MRPMVCAALLAILFAAQTPVEGSSIQTCSDSLLASLIAESMSNHPDLRAMRAMTEGEVGRAAMSRAWMNPDLRFGIMNAPTSLDVHADPMTMFQIGLMQRIPVPGKLCLSGQAGDARVAASEESVRAGEFEMSSMVAMAYYDLAKALQYRSILHRGLELTEEMMRASSAMLSGGMGSQADVQQAGIELEQWRIRIVSNESELARKRAALAYAIGRPDTVGLPDPVLPGLLPAELPKAGIENSPQVRMRDREVDAAELDLRRARLEYWPDVNVMLAYSVRPELRTTGVDAHTGEPVMNSMARDNMISAEISFSLPLYARGNQQARIREMSAMRREAENRVRDARLSKERELRDLEARWNESRAKHLLVVQSLLPRAEDTWRATLVDYRAGRVPLMNLTQARMNIVMAEMEEVMLRADSWMVQKQWLAALGLPLVESNSEGR